MADFFISFNKADREWAEWVAWELDAAGFTTTFQHWDFLPGENFVTEMDEAIRNSERTIAVLSPDYLASGFGAAEWRAAFVEDPTGEKGKLIPVRVRETVLSGLLKQVIYIDLVDVDEERARQNLLAGVARRRAKPDRPPRFPGRKKPGFPGEPLAAADSAGPTPAPEAPAASPPAAAPPSHAPRPAVQGSPSQFRGCARAAGILAVVLVLFVAMGLLVGLAVRRGWTGGSKPAPATLVPDGAPLRLDPDMHTEPIWKLGADAAGKTLASVSSDGTVRLWDLSRGRLLRTLRPPLGDPGHIRQNDGLDRLHAVALSPDGRLVATGGSVGVEDSTARNHSVYLLDVATGDVAQRIGGLPADVKDLTFSRDGQRLAISFGEFNFLDSREERRGIAVFRVADGQKLGEDLYGEFSYAADFDSKGRLVTTDFSGNVRLYDAQLKQIAATKLDRSAFEVRFSPDDRQIAVGNTSYSEVMVLDAVNRPLSRLRSLGDTGKWASVAWSADGSTLYAGNRDQPIIRRWAEGLAQGVDVRVRARVLDLLALPDGRMVFATAEPGWGILDTKDRIEIYQGPQALELGHRALLLDRTGISAGFETWGHPVVFRAGSLQLETGVKGLEPPVTVLPGMEVRIEGENCFLNGTELELNDFVITTPLTGGRWDGGEVALSYALSPKNQALFLGTSMHLIRYDQSGKTVWEVDLSKAATAVNVSGDGRLVVTFEEGLVRWYRADTGAHLLTLYVHPDLRRWAVWSPSGSFQAGEDAGHLIGWPISVDLDQPAVWVPASALPSRRRPEVLSRILN